MWKYTILLLSLTAYEASAIIAQPRHLVSANHFSWLPTLTPDQRRMKCQIKLGFSCECSEASKAYKVATSEPIQKHPFCESNPTHRWCIGACQTPAGVDEDFPRKELQTESKLGTDAEGVVTSTESSLEACHDKAKADGKDFFDFDSSDGTCRVASTRGTYLQQQVAGSTVVAYMRTDSKTGCLSLSAQNTFYQGNLNPSRSYSMTLRGQKISLGSISSPSKISSSQSSLEDCATAASVASATFYSYNSDTSDCIVSDDYVVSKIGACRENDAENCKETVYGAGNNDLKMCNAEDSVVDLCDEEDGMCHSTPRIHRAAGDDNFDQALVHATYSAIGKIKQCNYDGEVTAPTLKLDRELYPLAPCPSTEKAYYCDFPRNARFGDELEIVDYGVNGTTNFKCEADVRIQSTSTKIQDGQVTADTTAVDCEAAARAGSTSLFSFQATYSVCVKNGTELEGEEHNSQLKCERVFDQVWTIKPKNECILSTHNSSTVSETGATLYEITTRNSVGLPDGIREFANGFDKQTLQFSYEMQEPVSAAMAMNELSTNSEAITMNIFTVGRLMKDKIVLTSDASDSDNAAEVMAFFNTMALSGDDVPLSQLTAAKPDSAEWFPLDVGTNGVVDKLRCHSVADSTIIDFRNVTDIRTGFIDKFFASADSANDKSQCGTEDPDKYDIAVLDDERDSIPVSEQFKRCPNHKMSDNILYPSLRKAFFNPIISDGYRSGFMKGQRFIKEYGRSTEKVGSVSDGTTTKQYYHDKMMVAFNTEQLELCNTEMPDKSGYKILKTRSYPDSPDDGIDGKFGTGYDNNMVKHWGTRFCRSKITVTKYGKNPDTVIYQGYPSDVTGKYIKDYTYKVEITEEDCSDMEVREDHAVSAASSVPFDVEEAGAVVRITAAAEPDYCRTETGHYDSKQMDYSDGGVCLSHKQIPRKEGLSEDHPYGTLGSSNSAQCIEDSSGIDVTSVYGTKSSCDAVAGHTWIDFVNTNKRTDGGKCYKSSDDSLQTGSVCVKDGVILDMNETFCAVQLGEYVDLSVRENCEKVNAFEWVETDVSFGYVASVANASNPSQIIEQIHWEDSRLSCAHMGTSSGKSKYDRIRMTFFVDLLIGKDLFDEGKVNAGILPRGIPTGITEGAGTSSSAESCVVCESPETVGQHKIGGDDLDDVRENITDDEGRRQRFEDGYRAVGYGKSPTQDYEAVQSGNLQSQSEELVQIINQYVVRDIGSDEAAGGSSPFIDDSLTTISYLGLATTSSEPLNDAEQTLRGHEGDGKIYARYLVEMFSAECLDRTQQQSHSANLQIQIFKDGRWPAERLDDAQTCSGDGEGLDITTSGALARASANFESSLDLNINSQEICGPIETDVTSNNHGKLCDNGDVRDKIPVVYKVEQTGKSECAGSGEPLPGEIDIQQCAALAHAAGYDRIVFQQGVQCTACSASGDAGTGVGTSHLSVAVSGDAVMNIPACVAPSTDHYCQLCSAETYGCELKTDSERLMDMSCAGRDFHDKNARLALNAKLNDVNGAEDASNLANVNIAAILQTRGSFFGAELVEFSVGVSILDTIEFEEDQYVQLKGMGSRIEMIAWTRNTQNGLSDVRTQGDITDTSEVIITAQSYDREQDLASWNINIEGVSACSHATEDFLNSYVAAGVISQSVVDCVTKGDSSACDSIRTSCPMRTDTGFSLKKEEDDYYLLAQYRALFGRDGHLFISNTCDMLAISRLIDLLSFPDFGTSINSVLYQYSTNSQGDDAVTNACVKAGAPSADEFFRMIGPQGEQTPASQTIVRNFKAMMMTEARNGLRGVREVVPCRRLATHGDDLSPEFEQAILHGYAHASAFGNVSSFGARFEPRDCWMDGFTDSSGSVVRTHSGDSETCMTNILDRLASEYSFEDYLDSIGSAANFDEMVCTQKNNVWRQGSAGPSSRGYNKHIPCPWSNSNGIYNFDYSSVEAPAFDLTAEESAYRLSGSSPSWDAIKFHPADLGDLSQHYQPDTADFKLPVKVEVIVHGSTCSEGYDTASQRRRLLSFRSRQHIRGANARKLLQLESGDGVTPDARFGGGSSISFNVNVNLADSAAVQPQVIGMDEQGKETIVKATEEVKEQLGLEPTATEDEVREEIYKNVRKMVKESHSCMHKMHMSWVSLSFAAYYVLNFIVAAILAGCAPDLLTGKSPNVFFDPMAE